MAIGWAAYSSAFSSGASYGYYRYMYAPGGRAERQAAADTAFTEEEAAKKERYKVFRAERRAAAEAEATGATATASVAAARATESPDAPAEVAGGVAPCVVTAEEGALCVAPVVLHDSGGVS